MKNDRNKLKFKFSIAILLITLLTGFRTAAQVETDEVIKIGADINPNGKLGFSNRSFYTVIKTWDKNYVELQMHVKITAGNQEDFNKTMNAIKSIKFNGSSSRLTVNTNFWESCNCNDNKRKMKLSTGEKVTLKSYSVENTLFIPKTISIEIDNKYADIEMEDIVGSAEFIVYNGKLYCGSIGGATRLDLKYSKAFMNDVPETFIKLYNSDIEIKNCGNFEIESKYSKVKIENAGNMKFDAYNDDYNIGHIGKIDGLAKYSDFDFGPTGNLSFDFYDCNLKMGETGDVKGKSKYSEIVGSIAGKVTLNFSFNDTYTFDQIESLDCFDSKYSEFNLGLVKERLSIISYDDNISVDHFSNSFKGINFDGKYSDFIVAIPENVACKLLVDMKYGKVDYPEALFTRTSYVKENESFKMEAHTKNANENANCKIDLKGYDNKILIRN